MSTAESPKVVTLTFLQTVLLSYAETGPVHAGDIFRDGEKVGNLSQKSLDHLISQGLLTPVEGQEGEYVSTVAGREVCKLALITGKEGWQEAAIPEQKR